MDVSTHTPLFGSGYESGVLLENEEDGVRSTSGITIMEQTAMPSTTGTDDAAIPEYDVVPNPTEDALGRS